MTDFPNREHQRADEAARRRALNALNLIKHKADELQRRLQMGPEYRLDADDAQGLGDNVQRLSGFLGELGTLYDVRQWHAADLDDASEV